MKRHAPASLGPDRVTSQWRARAAGLGVCRQASDLAEPDGGLHRIRRLLAHLP